MQYDLFGLLHMTRKAYICAFTGPNIIKAFKKAGLWLVHFEALFRWVHQKLVEEPDAMVGADGLKTGSK